MRETACAGGTIGNRGIFVKVDRPVKKLDTQEFQEPFGGPAAAGVG